MKHGRISCQCITANEASSILSSRPTAVENKTPETLWCYNTRLCSDQRVTGCCCNATVVLPVFSHVDVAFVAPVFTPAAGRPTNYLSWYVLLFDIKMAALLDLNKLPVRQTCSWRSSIFCRPRPLPQSRNPPPARRGPAPRCCTPSHSRFLKHTKKGVKLGTNGFLTQSQSCSSAAKEGATTCLIPLTPPSIKSPRLRNID